MARNPGPFGHNGLLRPRTDMRRRSAVAPRRRVAFTAVSERDPNLNRDSLAPLLPRGNAPGAQLLGEGKWQETLGFTPT